MAMFEWLFGKRKAAEPADSGAPERETADNTEISGMRPADPAAEGTASCRPETADIETAGTGTERAETESTVTESAVTENTETENTETENTETENTDTADTEAADPETAYTEMNGKRPSDQKISAAEIPAADIPAAEIPAGPVVPARKKGGSGKGKKKKKKSLYDWNTGKKKKGGDICTPRTVTVGDLTLGEGLPAVCVPLTGRNREELLAQTERALQAGADLIEWRADFLEIPEDGIQTAALADEIRAMIGGIPLIYTLRTEPEGGELPFDAALYDELIRRAADMEEVDLIDIEALHLETDAAALCEYARTKGKKVIASAHFFDGTPKKEEMHRIFLREERMGADILKLAAMPQKPGDVLRLMQACLQFHEETGAVMITMSMGEMGKISRVSGSLTGSAVSFGTAGQSSAPGQIPAEELRSVMQLL